jgi:uncharacterized protein
MSLYQFEDMKKSDRGILGDSVPLELFRSVRLIGMYQGLPLHGKNTTLTVGREIGVNLPVETIDDVFRTFEELRIGIPEIVKQNDKEMHIAVKDCFCLGLPVNEGHMVCDLEGAILGGAISKIFNKRVSIREIKCNINGDEHCEYIIRFT